MSSAQASSSQYVSGGGGNSSGKLKSVDALPSMIEGSKFLKWNESGGSSFDKNNNAIGVTLRTDDKCFILFWRDANKKTEYLDLLSVRDVKTGRYASLPRVQKKNLDYSKLFKCLNCRTSILETCCLVASRALPFKIKQSQSATGLIWSIFRSLILYVLLIMLKK